MRAFAESGLVKFWIPGFAYRHHSRNFGSLSDSSQ